MIKTTGMLHSELNRYANPAMAIQRLVRKGTLTPVRNGLYETDPSIPAHCLAMMIYGPSYLSFQYALSQYGLIPETVTRLTSATCGKHKRKEFRNAFGIYSYQDVPMEVFPWEIRLCQENSYPFMIASPEKALCDLLYTISPLQNRKEMETCLFDDLRIDRSAFSHLNIQTLYTTAGLYHTKNHRLLGTFLRKEFRHVIDH